jgi:hypothetical protein
LIKLEEIKAGTRVHYIPFKGAKISDMENGIVKSIHPDCDKAWVVYHCAGEWDRYYKYTGALTRFEDLEIGWIL